MIRHRLLKTEFGSLNHQGLLWNLHCIATVVLKNKFNFTRAVIRSKRSTCFKSKARSYLLSRHYSVLRAELVTRPVASEHGNVHPNDFWVFFKMAATHSQFLSISILTAREIYTPRHASSVVKWTIIGKMAIAITLRGFNDLGRSVTPIFLSLGHFLYLFSTFCEKMKKSIE